jgi:plastocyanin
VYVSKRSWRPVNVRKAVAVGSLLLALALAACSSPAPAETPAPEATATTVPEATATTEPEVTATSEPEVTATTEPEATATTPPEATATPEPTATAVSQAEVTPVVMVSDQEIVDGTVTIEEVVSNGPGWLVIHADADGAPGPVLGYTAVEDGENTGVEVQLDMGEPTETLYAMLHTDTATVGSYEFPGPDGPIQVDGQVVAPAFTAREPAGVGAETNTVSVSMVNFAFSPAQLEIPVGTTVTWTNGDEGIGHTATSDDGLWDSGIISTGESFSFTFEEPGEYPYYCKPHGGPGGQGMSGTIVVVP